MNKCGLFSGKHNGVASVGIAVPFMKGDKRSKRRGKGETKRGDGKAKADIKPGRRERKNCKIN